MFTSPLSASVPLFIPTCSLSTPSFEKPDPIQATRETLSSCSIMDVPTEFTGAGCSAGTLDSFDRECLAASFTSRSVKRLLGDDRSSFTGAGCSGVPLDSLDRECVAASFTRKAPKRPFITGETPLLPFDMVPLNPAPRLPKDDNTFNMIEADRWARAFPNGRQRKVMLDLIKHVQRVDFHTFADHLQQTSLKCATLLGKSDYVVLVEPTKSNQWVAELAVPILATLGECLQPSAVLALGNSRSQGFKNFIAHQYTLDLDERYLPSNVVLFDDGTFSGQQMSKFVDGVLQAYVDVDRETSPRFPHVIVVCPYATSIGQQRILNVAITHGCEGKVTFLSNQRIPLLSELFTKREDRELLGTTFWKSEEAARKREQAIETVQVAQRRDGEPLSRHEWHLDEDFRAGPFSRGSLYFAHKVPNARSFLLAIEHGYIDDIYGKLQNGTLDFVGPERMPTFTPHSAKDTYSMIPRTTPPYKG